MALGGGGPMYCLISARSMKAGSGEKRKERNGSQEWKSVIERVENVASGCFNHLLFQKCYSLS